MFYLLSSIFSFFYSSSLSSFPFFFSSLSPIFYLLYPK